jgi:hypothetical protein
MTKPPSSTLSGTHSWRHITTLQVRRAVTPIATTVDFFSIVLHSVEFKHATTGRGIITLARLPVANQ